MKVVGYGVCGPNQTYLRRTLEEFARLCDHVVIVCNNITDKERQLLEEFNVEMVEDNREWGKHQPHIKEDLVRNYVAPHEPDWCICLDMDESFDSTFTREVLPELEPLGDSFLFYVVNLWGNGWKPERSFWNVRAWRWNKELEERVAEKFFEFEKKPVHCGLAPKWCYQVASHAPHLLIHRGLKTKGLRGHKIKRYEKYDPNARHMAREYYESLYDDDYEKYDEERVLATIQAGVGKLKQKPKNVESLSATDPIVFIKRKSDGKVLDMPKSRASGVLKNDNFEFLYERKF